MATASATRLTAERTRLARAPRLLLVVVAVAVLVVACGEVLAPPPGSSAPDLSAGARPASPSATPTTLSEDELLTAIRFRRAFGLRDDEAWIAEVAANPASAQAAVDFGTPLLPAEAAELLRHTANMERIAGPIRWYGEANPDTWAGMFIDHQAGGAIVAQFSAQVDAHLEHLSALLPDDARFEVREATWSLRELEAFGRRVEADRAWFDSIGADVRVAGYDEALNQVLLNVESRDADDRGRIRDHLGDPAWLGEIRWDPPEWTGPRGDLVIVVVDERGRPLAGMDCGWAPLDPLVSRGASAYDTRDDGRCLIPRLPAIEYEVRIGAPNGDGYTTVATKRAWVKANDRTVVRIVLDSDR